MCFPLSGICYFCTLMKAFEKEVADVIGQRGLFAGSDKILVALSGGADSVALLRLLLALGYHCGAAHCNFHLRGDESMRDEAFVERLCEELGVELHTTDFDTRQYAAAQHLSIEMAARELRYAYFARLQKEYGYNKIAVGHHQNDNAETVIVNLMRGTGLKGLIGMRYRNGDIIRPLLGFSKTAILAYLEELGQDFVDDSSNMEADVVRNKIRLQIMPLMREVNPSIEKAIQQTVDHLGELETYFRHAIAKDIDCIVERPEGLLLKINVSRLMESENSHLLLFEILFPLGFNSAQVDDIYRSLGHTGAMFQSAQARLLIDRESILVQSLDEDPEREVAIIPPAEAHLGDCCIKLTMRERHELEAIPKEADRVAVDADKLALILTLRYVRHGERFQPFGMKGRKLVSDYLTDVKMSRFEKQKQCVVCSGGEIVWLVGQRVDQRFAVTPETRRILLMTLC